MTLPLLKSPQYEPVRERLIEIWGASPTQADEWIENVWPCLLRPDCTGHDENGNPCLKCKGQRDELDARAKQYLDKCDWC